MYKNESLLFELVKIPFLPYSIRKKYQLFHGLLTMKKSDNEDLSSTTFHRFNVQSFRRATFDYLFDEIFINRSYFPRNNAYKENRKLTIIDCGANIGLSVLYFKWLYPNSSITAFEADKETFELLKKNVLRNKLKQVTIHHSLLSDTNGKTKLFSNKKGSLMASVHRDRLPDEDNLSEHLTDKEKLSKYIKNKHIDILKMDIEGSEFEVFNDLIKQDLLSNIDTYMIEFHITKQNEELMKEIALKLKEKGFKVSIKKQKNAPIQTKYVDYVMNASKISA